MISGTLFLIGILMVAAGDVYFMSNPVGGNLLFTYILLAGQILTVGTTIQFLYRFTRA